MGVTVKEPVFYTWPKMPQDVLVDDGCGNCWVASEFQGVAPKPHANTNAEFFTLREVFSVKDVAEIIRIGSEVLDQNVQRGDSRWADSVDGWPTFEYYFINHGSYHPALEHVLRPVMEQRITPYVRRKYGAPHAMVCTCLFRRYLPEERRIHPAHFDHQAFVTAVVGLNPEDFKGGLYVQGNVALERRYVPLDRGDVCVHRYDLHHGVEVCAGTRYSIIFWFMDTPEACLRNTRFWYKRGAEAGDSDAQYNWATCLADGDGSGQSKNFSAALPWYEKAAAQDNLQAINALAKAHWDGQNVPVDVNKAICLWRKAAELGYTKAQTNLGGVIITGADGRVARNVTEGVRLLCKAAENGDAEACFKLGYHGRCIGDAGLVRWLRHAAELGHPNACAICAEMCIQGIL